MMLFEVLDEIYFKTHMSQLAGFLKATFAPTCRQDLAYRKAGHDNETRTLDHTDRLGKLKSRFFVKRDLA